MREINTIPIVVLFLRNQAFQYDLQPQLWKNKLFEI